jgi:hypothetical protein
MPEESIPLCDCKEGSCLPFTDGAMLVYEHGISSFQRPAKGGQFHKVRCRKGQVAAQDARIPEPASS